MNGLSSVLGLDSIEKFGRGENVRIFGSDEYSVEDVFAKIVIVAERASVIIKSNDVSTCHCLPSGGKGPKPILAKIVRRDTKHQLMKKKRNLIKTLKYLLMTTWRPIMPR